MLKKIIPLILIIGIICIFAVNSDAKYISRNGDRIDKWEKDIDYIADKLPKKHKNMFFKLNEEEFKNGINELKGQLNQINDAEIKVSLSQIVASIGDAHTSINFSAEKMFPLEFYWFNDGIYLINTSEDYKDFKYKKLKKINNKDINEIIERISLVVSHENEAILKSQIPLRIALPELLKGLNIIENVESATFTFEDNSEKSINVKALDGEEVFENIFGKDREGENIPLYMQNKDKYYWFKHLEDKKTVYFNYSQCMEIKEKPFKEFSAELMNVINTKGVEKLIIDIRNNGGGNSMILENLINEIGKSELNKKGKLFVIIGRRTFSSAILNAIELNNNTDAIFVGEPTGGKPNHYGEVKSFELPNNKITVRYSSKYFKNYDKDMDTLVPDKNIELTIEDYINNVDPVLEYILQ
jgi:hypothetical protein